MTEKETEEALAGCIVAVLAIPFVIGTLFGIAYLAVLVFAGFGVEIPYWPTFGGLVLISIVANWFRSKKG